MPTIDGSLFARLSGYAGLAALVGIRVYPAPIPQNATYPLCTYQEISRVPIHVMGATLSVAHIRYQVDSWAATLATAKAVAAQVELALDNYAGTSDSVVIKNTFLEVGQSMDYDPTEGMHRYMQEFVMEYVKP
jgi:hypothetical protein